MKKLILTAAICLGTITVSAQGWVYSEEFKTDIWTSQDKGMDYVDCRDGTGYDAWNALYCTRKKGIESVVRVGSRPNTSGLYGKVAAATRRAQPRNGSSATSAGTRSVGSYNYNTSDAHIQWARDRQAQIQAAREAAAYRKKMKEIQKRIADNNRAEAVAAQTNAALQAQTDARIQSDHWHATQGAVLAQQRARQAVVAQRPQFDSMKPQSTGSQQASRLRGANKPRRFMVTPNPNTRNSARNPMPAVRRSHVITPQQREELRQAVRDKQEQQRQLLLARAEKQNAASKKSPAAYYNDKGQLVLDEHAYSSLGQGGKNGRPVPYPKSATAQSPGARYTNGGRLMLDEHAHSSLGQDWYSDDLKPLPYPPAPATKVRRTMTQEEYHNLIAIEMIDQRPMTPAEKRYYENLTF